MRLRDSDLETFGLIRNYSWGRISSHDARAFQQGGLRLGCQNIGLCNARRALNESSLVETTYAGEKETRNLE